MRVISDLSVVDVFNLAIVLYLWFYRVLLNVNSLFEMHVTLRQVILSTVSL